MTETRDRLKEAYEEWKAKMKSDAHLARLSPPLLLSTPLSYSNEAKNAVVFGQETLGWSWSKGLRQKYPLYKNDYPFNDLGSCADFINNSDCVDALQWGYEQFNFAENQRRNYNSPFWAAFREVQKWGFENVIWTNLSKCDYDSGSVLKLDRARLQKFIADQVGLVESELHVLKPECSIFFTGPNYDHLLKLLFPGVIMESVSDSILHLAHTSLPKKSFRTYHPAYLRRSGQWSLLEKVRILSAV